MASKVKILAGLALGLGLMYLLDPERGNSRRALLRDQVGSALRRTGDRAEKQARDLRNRAQGLAHDLGSAVHGAEEQEATADDTVQVRRGRISPLPG